MEYFAKILFSAAVIALLVVGHQKSSKTQNKNSKWFFFGLAGVVWVLGVLFLQATWIEMLISLAGVLLFAWLANSFVDDAKQVKKHKSL